MEELFGWEGLLSKKKSLTKCEDQTNTVRGANGRILQEIARSES